MLILTVTQILVLKLKSNPWSRVRWPVTCDTRNHLLLYQSGFFGVFEAAIEQYSNGVVGKQIISQVQTPDGTTNSISKDFNILVAKTYAS
jgi:hypothetical protein